MPLVVNGNVGIKSVQHPQPLNQGFPTWGSRPPRAVFLKVRSADHFWSAGIFNLVCEIENRSYFKLLCYKKGQLWRKTSYFMVRRRLFRDFGVRQIFFPYFMVRKLKKFGKHCPRGTWGVGKGDASFFGLIGKNIIFEIFADLNRILADFTRTQLEKLKIFITYNPSPSKEHLTRLTYTTWGDAKQVWRSTILSSTIILIFFDNWRMGHF
jgi:hypothetical protein